MVDSAVIPPPVDDGWPESGQSTLTWLLAAYEVWRNSAETVSVQWRNAHGYDLLLTGPSGDRVRINAKRSWRCKDGQIGFGGPSNPDKEVVDVFALVVLEKVDVQWSPTKENGVNLHASAGPAEIFFVPVDIVSKIARPDGRSVGRVLIEESLLREYTTLSWPASAVGSELQTLPSTAQAQ
jgi:hypothetical protein